MAVVPALGSLQLPLVGVGAAPQLPLGTGTSAGHLSALLSGEFQKAAQPCAGALEKRRLIPLKVAHGRWSLA
jgi:hypothetical protein